MRTESVAASLTRLGAPQNRQSTNRLLKTAMSWHSKSILRCLWEYSDRSRAARSEVCATPAFAYQVIDGVARSSARSVPGFDLHRALEGISNKLNRFGGHAAAAGFAADASLIPEIVEHLETQMSWSSLSSRVDERIIRTVDAEFELNQLGYSLWDFINMMAPFGTGNPEPLFLIRKAQTGNIRYMGRNQDHVSLTLYDDDGRQFRAVGFGMADTLPPTRDRGRRCKPKDQLLSGQPHSRATSP